MLDWYRNADTLPHTDRPTVRQNVAIEIQFSLLFANARTDSKQESKLASTKHISSVDNGRGNSGASACLLIATVAAAAALPLLHKKLYVFTFLKFSYVCLWCQKCTKLTTGVSDLIVWWSAVERRRKRRRLSTSQGGTCTWHSARWEKRENHVYKWTKVENDEEKKS